MANQNTAPRFDSVEIVTPDYFPNNTVTSPLVETYGGWVQYVSDSEGIIIQRIWYK